MQELDVFYDRYGRPILRLLTGGRLVDFDGRSIGFTDGPLLYNYNGEHVGWLEGGIIRDLNGHTAGFGEKPTDSPKPFLPFKQFKPFPSFVEFEPFRPFKQFPQFKPFKSFGWSPYDPRSLFLGLNSGESDG